MSVHFMIELDREEDGRWIAEIPSLPGVMAYGPDADAAIMAVKVLALRVLAEKLETGETPPDIKDVVFESATIA